MSEVCQSVFLASLSEGPFSGLSSLLASKGAHLKHMWMTDKMAQRAEVEPADKSDDYLNVIPGTPMIERTDSHKLSFDLHMCHPPTNE